MIDIRSEQVAEFAKVPDGVTELPRIFVFCNGGAGTDMVSMTALSQDGEFLAGHLCSSESWGWHDMGFSSEWKHERYAARYPNGFALVWVPGDPRKHSGVMAAHAKHVAAGELGTAWNQEQAAKRTPAEAPHRGSEGQTCERGNE